MKGKMGQRSLRALYCRSDNCPCAGLRVRSVIDVYRECVSGFGSLGIGKYLEDYRVDLITGSGEFYKVARN